MSRIVRAVARAARAVTGPAPAPLPVAPAEPVGPADFREWVGRRSDKLRYTSLRGWEPLARDEDSPVLAVVVHVFYVDLLPEILDSLKTIPVPFDLLLTNASGGLVEPDVSELPLARSVRVFDVDNHGRDILPLVLLVNAGLLDGYEIVCKVHTKKSPWREEHDVLGGSGEAWRSGFLEGLFGSRTNVERILSTFATDRTVGSITTPGNIVGPEHWGGDRHIVESLLRRLELRSSDELRFNAGSIYWISGFLVRGLRSLDLSEQDFEPEEGQIDGTTAHAVERIIGILTTESGLRLTTTDDLVDGPSDAWRRYERRTERAPRARVVPFYLPQFHTFPENDAWWGAGFTEWSNVTAAKPMYLGHRQPLLPGELGFYDLAHDDVRQRQFALAQNAGIEGFMYYYYWFAGRTLMDGPVEKLAAGDDDHPFCLMWANENWTRRWDGSTSSVLIGQDYESVPAEQFIDDVMHLLTDRRYITVDGRPVIAVYRITQIPDYREVIASWRRAAEAAGLPGLQLLTVDVGTSMEGLETDLSEEGLDGYLEFPPHNKPWVGVRRDDLAVVPGFEGLMLRYDAMAEACEQSVLTELEDDRYPGVLVGFDNTARRQYQPDLWYGSNPFTFRRWLATTVLAVERRRREDRLVFINAWNEWAEGAVLEPTQRFGRAYLDAVADVLLR
jgi:lipopolysaccharide biosynthesis protein